MKLTLVSKLIRTILPVSLMTLALPSQVQAASPTLLSYWDFNDPSDPGKTLDKIYAFEGLLENGAAFSADEGGHTGLAGDFAMDFGPDSAQQLVRVSNAPFLNIAAAQDQITISFWQKLVDVANSSAFWGVSASAGSSDRGIQAHTPWSDNNVYYDTAGCCTAGQQRLNGSITAWKPDLDLTQWHHFVFLKNGPLKQVWVDGEKFLEGSGAAPLPTDFTQLMIGADNAGGNSLHGLEDDFAVYAGALDDASIGLLASGTPPDKLPGVIIPAGPLIGGALATPAGFTLDITESATTAIVADTLTIKLDGATITPASVTKVDLVTSIRYELPAGTYFPSGSSHTVELSVKDSVGTTASATREFSTVSYALLPASARVPADTSKPGFVWNVHHNNALQSTDNDRPELQLTGKLIDPATGSPYDNTADATFQGSAIAAAEPADPTWKPLHFEIDTVINLSQTAGENNGAFTPDGAMPGIAGDLNGIAAEIITYLDLPAGLTTMGVNSDDGFRTWGGDPADAFKRIQLGEFNGGRGAADTIFYFVAQEAGVYCFRTVWEEGGGGANIEWFTLKADGTKVLVNDTANGGVPAYRATTAARKPYVSSVSPGPAPRQLNAVSPKLVVELVDGDIEKVDDASIALKLDGKALATTKERTGNVVTLTYVAEGLQIPSEAHTGELTFTGTAGTSRNDQWTFRNLKNLVLPTPTILDTFDSYPEDSQPTDWVAWNFTARNVEGRNITSQTSESYEDWVLVNVANITSIDGARPYNITPGQFITVNGTTVELQNANPVPEEAAFPAWLMSGNVLYAESDSRQNADSRGAADFPNNGQTQFITTKPYDVSAFKGVVVTFSSIYEQNQDSLGAVEYSVDGGKNWLPVMYFLEEADIKFKADGSVDAIRTFNDANSDTSTWVDNGVAKGGKYGDGLGAPITDALGIYVVPRINDGQVEGKRVEVARLDQATGKSDVRLRFAAMGTDSWYFAIDNLAFYDIPAGGVVEPAPKFNAPSLAAGKMVLSWTGSGTLEESASLSGPWSTAGSQANPQDVTTAGAAKFYRIKR
jgi:hypothetical protein